MRWIVSRSIADSRSEVGSPPMEDIPVALAAMATARGWIIEADATPPCQGRDAMIVKAIAYLALAVGKLAKV
jgi:hypothetical protein